GGDLRCAGFHRHVIARDGCVARHHAVLYPEGEHIGDVAGGFVSDHAAHFLATVLLEHLAVLGDFLHDVWLEEGATVGNRRYSVYELDRRGGRALAEGGGVEVDGTIAVAVWPAYQARNLGRQ